MNKRLCTFLISSVLCCILTFALYPFIRSSIQSKSGVPGLTKKNHAFATILCDPLTIDATLVSIYSLKVAFAKKPSSESDIVVLIPDSVYIESETVHLFEKLGTQIIKTSFARSSCINSQQALLNLWALFDYQKVVYFTHDILFDNDVDQLFYQLPNSAVLSNSRTPSLLILEPSPENFEIMVEDQKRDNPVQSKLRNSANALLNSKSMYAFTGSIKPWNFHSYNEADWRNNLDPVAFYNWRRLNTDLNFFLNPENKWNNSLRQSNVCDNYIESVNGKVNHFPVQDQFSVMISTYNPERIEHLSQIIQHLLKSDKVHTVFITWHNPSLEVPSSLYDSIRKEDYPRVKVLKQAYDSLNNRFNPVDGLKTEAVYIMDDDIFIDLKDLEFTFDVWASHKDSIVGHFPRRHTYDPVTHNALYKLIKRTPYTIILTKSMFIHSDYLFAYTCLLEPKLHEYVDNHLNCEDLGFAMMASGISNAPPTYVRLSNHLEDFGLKKGISTNSLHMPARAACISDFITQFWNEKDPLIKSYDTVVHFSAPEILVGNWSRVMDIMSSTAL